MLKCFAPSHTCFKRSFQSANELLDHFTALATPSVADAISISTSLGHPASADEDSTTSLGSTAGPLACFTCLHDTSTAVLGTSARFHDRSKRTFGHSVRSLVSLAQRHAHFMRRTISCADFHHCFSRIHDRSEAHHGSKNSCASPGAIHSRALACSNSRAVCRSGQT